MSPPAGEKSPEPPRLSGELRRKSRPDKKAGAVNSRLFDGSECRQKRQSEMTGCLARQHPASSAASREPHVGLLAKLRRETSHGLFCRFSLRHGVLLRPTPFVVCGVQNAFRLVSHCISELCNFFFIRFIFAVKFAAVSIIILQPINHAAVFFFADNPYAVIFCRFIHFRSPFVC